MTTFEFDEDSFLEQYLQDYYQNDDIAVINDICVVLDHEYEDDPERTADLRDAGLLDMTEEELKEELNELERKVLAQAFEDYLNTHHPVK